MSILEAVECDNKEMHFEHLIARKLTYTHAIKTRSQNFSQTSTYSFAPHPSLTIIKSETEKAIIKSENNNNH